MEKIEKITKKIESAKHSFYCDECNKYIGTSEEYEDGWYENLGAFELRFYIDNWYHINKCLCDDCRSIFINNLKSTLKDVGFKNGYN